MDAPSPSDSRPPQSDVHERDERDKHDRELAERIRRGDSAAFDALYRASFEGLVKLAYSYVRAPDVAEEIVQDVFLGVWEKRAKWIVTSSVRVYLYTAVRNRSLNAANHNTMVERVRHTTAAAGLPAPPVAGVGNQAGPIDESTAARDLEQRIEQAIRTLTPGQREALTLHWKHNLTLSEIAEVMGVSADGARMQLRRAQNALWELVGPLVGEP